MRYGYIRVSTREQNPERQYQALKGSGVGERDIYLDKMSGKDFSRPAYQKLLARLRKGDVLVVKSIDRLGRNYEEILEQWQLITKRIKADIQVLDMPLLDTRNEKDDLTGVFIADLVLQILAYVAQTEREFIRQRQAEGIAAAKQQGVRFGRKPMKRPLEYRRLKKQWQRGEISARNAARQLGITHRTFLIWVNEDGSG